MLQVSVDENGEICVKTDELTDLEAAALATAPRDGISLRNQSYNLAAEVGDVADIAGGQAYQRRITYSERP